MHNKFISYLRVFIFLIVIFVFSPLRGLSQPEKLLELPAHADATKMPWWDSIYRFPNFQYSRLIYRTGFSPPDQFLSNYNMYFGTIEFISSKGDTLQVTPNKELQMVDMGGHIFYLNKNKEYIEILSQGPIALGGRTIFHSEKKDFDSGDAFHGPSYGSYSRSSGFSGGGGNASDETAAVDFRGQRSNFDRYYRKTTSFFFIDKHRNKLYPASKNSIQKLFSNDKHGIDAYLLENNIDFTKLEDLAVLLNFCEHLGDKKDDAVK